MLTTQFPLLLLVAVTHVGSIRRMSDLDACVGSTSKGILSDECLTARLLAIDQRGGYVSLLPISQNTWAAVQNFNLSDSMLPEIGSVHFNSALANVLPVALKDMSLKTGLAADKVNRTLSDMVDAVANTTGDWDMNFLTNFQLGLLPNVTVSLTNKVNADILSLNKLIGVANGLNAKAASTATAALQSLNGVINNGVGQVGAHINTLTSSLNNAVASAAIELPILIAQKAELNFTKDVANVTDVFTPEVMQPIYDSLRTANYASLSKMEAKVDELLAPINASQQLDAWNATFNQTEYDRVDAYTQAMVKFIEFLNETNTSAHANSTWAQDTISQGLNATIPTLNSNHNGTRSALADMRTMVQNISAWEIQAWDGHAQEELHSLNARLANASNYIQAVVAGSDTSNVVGNRIASTMSSLSQHMSNISQQLMQRSSAGMAAYADLTDKIANQAGVYNSLFAQVDQLRNALAYSGDVNSTANISANGIAVVNDIQARMAAATGAVGKAGQNVTMSFRKASDVVDALVEDFATTVLTKLVPNDTSIVKAALKAVTEMGASLMRSNHEISLSANDALNTGQGVSERADQADADASNATSRSMQDLSGKLNFFLKTVADNAASLGKLDVMGGIFGVSRFASSESDNRVSDHALDADGIAASASHALTSSVDSAQQEQSQLVALLSNLVNAATDANDDKVFNEFQKALLVTMMDFNRTLGVNNRPSVRLDFSARSLDNSVVRNRAKDLGSQVRQMEGDLIGSETFLKKFEIPASPYKGPNLAPYLNSSSTMSNIVQAEVQLLNTSLRGLQQGAVEALKNVSVENVSNISWNTIPPTFVNQTKMMESIATNASALPSLIASSSTRDAFIRFNTSLADVLSTFNSSIFEFKQFLNSSNLTAANSMAGTSTVSPNVLEISRLVGLLSEIIANTTRAASAGLEASLDIFGSQALDGNISLTTSSPNLTNATVALAATQQATAMLNSVGAAVKVAQSNSAQAALNQINAADALVQEAIGSAMSTVANQTDPSGMAAGGVSVATGVQTIVSEYGALENANQPLIEAFQKSGSSEELRALMGNGERDVYYDVLDAQREFRSWVNEIVESNATFFRDRGLIDAAVAEANTHSLTDSITAEQGQELLGDEAADFKKVSDNIASIIESLSNTPTSTYY